MGKEGAVRRHKKRQLYFRGKTLEEILAMTPTQQVEMYRARIRRRLRRSYGFRYKKFVDKIRKAKEATQPGEKPAMVKTHLRDAGKHFRHAGKSVHKDQK